MHSGVPPVSGFPYKAVRPLERDSSEAGDRQPQGTVGGLLCDTQGRTAAAAVLLHDVLGALVYRYKCMLVHVLANMGGGREENCGRASGSRLAIEASLLAALHAQGRSLLLAFKLCSACGAGRQLLAEDGKACAAHKPAGRMGATAKRHDQIGVPGSTSTAARYRAGMQSALPMRRALARQPASCSASWHCREGSWRQTCAAAVHRRHTAQALTPCQSAACGRSRRAGSRPRPPPAGAAAPGRQRPE